MLPSRPQKSSGYGRSVGQGGDRASLSAKEVRDHGAFGAELLLGGPDAIKSFLSEHIGRGRLGNDYRRAFGQVFEPFYSHRLQEAWLPVCQVLAEYVGENFRFTGQSMAFGVETKGLPPVTLRALCKRHDIGVKIVAQMLKSKYGRRFGFSEMIDPKLVAEIAPLVKIQMNAQAAARYLGVSIEVLYGVIADRLIVPDFRFNERMMGFLPTTLDAF